MQLRPFQDGDLDAVVDVFTAAVHTGAAARYSVAQRNAWAPRPPDKDAWRLRLTNLRVLLAVQGGSVAGFIGFTDDGVIDLLFTHPDFLRRGVATRLYRAAEDALALQGVTTFTTAASLAAEPFFARHGFTVVEREEVTRGGVALSRCRMHKQLTVAQP